MKKKFFHTLILSCKEATFLVEKKEQGKMSLKEAIQLKIHLWICKACKIYAKQSKVIDAIFRKKSQIKTESKLDENIKQKIIKKINS